ncbi:hypothetical protein DRQ25_14395 [Candidatus Fermentibacteria bacterium]|nr:MAG: hypothetical protein DRQ25_14395 [Candidatus Fermentibacteria bacterium]
MAQYLLDYIEEQYVKVKENDIIFLGKIKMQYEKAKSLGGENVIKTVCPECKKPRKTISKIATFVCSACEHQAKSESDYMKCPHDGTVMERFATTNACGCGSALPAIKKFNILSLIEVDTILLASRHLYRMPFSLHEKSGLVSVLIDPKTVLKFKKASAKPGAALSGKWLAKPDNLGEATDLLAKAMAHQAETEKPKERREFTAPEEAVPEELFPPCIRLILAGLKDGKKRALFILTNFLSAVGWNNEMIEERIWEWNKANPESLRPVIIKSHLKLKSKKREIILPPNCKSDYYKALGVCKPDDMCKTIKNPAQYALRRFRAAQGTAGKGGGRAKLTEEQKAARRLYRERMKRKEEEKKGGDNGAADDKE